VSLTIRLRRATVTVPDGPLTLLTYYLVSDPLRNGGVPAYMAVHGLEVLSGGKFLDDLHAAGRWLVDLPSDADLDSAEPGEFDWVFDQYEQNGRVEGSDTGAAFAGNADALRGLQDSARRQSEHPETSATSHQDFHRECWVRYWTGYLSGLQRDDPGGEFA
jgi:hypothetical protein